MLKKVLNWYTSRASLPFWLIGLTDCATVYLAGVAAYALNHSLSVAVGNLYGLMATVAVFLVCFVAGFRLFHTYSGIIRMTTTGDLARIFAALSVGGLLAVVLKVLTPVDALMVSPYRIRDLITLIFLASTGMCGLRMTAKLFYDLYLRYSTGGGAYGYAHKDLISMEMSDLLPREPITVDMEEVRGVISGHCVMVTGAAGSIGSELAYLLASVGPSELVLIDLAESPLHDVRINMARLYPGIRCHTIVTSICHSSRMDRIFSAHRPDFIFHAAAYKHVPMMEDNPVESVLNNIDGTRKIADLAVKHGVRKFVMVSTDKAVNPTNVMGCSKRICEMYCQALSGAGCRTQFITTRFGNVLGSNGSVIPTFREQIRRGGPVLVTHPKIIRYFMLISEACSLVLQAATLGKGGEIFAFDMGRPVRIVDLARRMILLSGRLDVGIEFTGLRPGEKLYEEVLTDSERVVPTPHPKIKAAKVRPLDIQEVDRDIGELIATARRYDVTGTVRMMKWMVPEYRSTPNSPYALLDPAPPPAVGANPSPPRPAPPVPPPRHQPMPAATIA